MKALRTKVRAQALPSALLLMTAALASACSDPESSGGEVMVVVTTDMAVPTDFDRLTWSVTLDGDTEPIRQGTVELEGNADFPATLAIAAGPKATEPVTIRIEGRSRDIQDLVRVTREATLRIPEAGTAKLAMPLSWLCSDANLPTPCDEGQTCKAGTCADAAVLDSSLPTYEPLTPRECADVVECFAEITFGWLPARDAETGDCTIEGRVGDDANVNVVLAIDNERVGNYGFCGPLNECHVILPREDGPEGWQLSSTAEGTPVIKLPGALCQGAAAQNIRGVDLLGIKPGCPNYERETPLCPPPADTCLSAEICPSPWGDAWPGFACSGPVAPLDVNPGVQGCWHPELAPGQPWTAVNGRWCCTTGQEPSEDELLIDDMSGGPQIKLAPPEGQVAGVWWTSLGEGSGPLSPAPYPSLFTYRTFDPPIEPANGPEITSAACLSSPGFLGYVAMLGFYFGEEKVTHERTPWDLSEYTGISFWGWAAEPFPDASLSIEVEFPNADTNWSDPDAACYTPVDRSKRCDNFQADVALTGQWKQYFVRWDELHQSFEDWNPPQYKPPGGFDRTTVNSTIFTVHGASRDIASQPFDFCVAHVSFTR